eukprot:COSAG04_NODE_178_length_21394_cov_8.221507_2_plen_237_part_00
MTVAIARQGKLAYMQTCGCKDAEEGEPPRYIPPSGLHSSQDASDIACIWVAFFSRCQRSLPTGADISPSTIFRIYSMTKPIVSAAAMILYEEGKFQLDGPIAEHLPEFEEPRVYVSGGTDGEPLVTEPVRERPFPKRRPLASRHHSAVAHTDGSRCVAQASRGITFRDLLTHTSGLSYGDSDSVVDKLYRQELGQASWEDSIRMRLNLKEFVERIARVIRAIIAGIWVAFFQECQQ